MKYKVGDLVKIKSLDWYDDNKDEDGIVELSTHVFTPGMSQFCGKVMTIEDVFEDIDDNVVYYMEEIDYDWTDEMIECKVEEEVGLVDNLSSRWVNEFNLPDGYIFKDENGNVINATKIVLEKKNKYPKTYEECAKILLERASVRNDFGYKADLLVALQKLLVCRDACWKLYGEKMGLGKPWKPDWTDLDQLKYCIWVDVGEFITMTNVRGQHILAFPTKEMRDAFYENFKSEIKICKELL